MKKLLKLVEKIIQVITIVSGLWAAIEGIRLYSYKKKLKQKAEVYLEDEMEFDTNVNGCVKVYSPSIEEKQSLISKLLIATGIGLAVSIVLNLINRNQY